MDKYRLISCEATKHLTRFYIIFISVMLFIASTVAVYDCRSFFTADYRDFRAKKAELISLYDRSPEEYEKLLTEYNSRFEKYIMSDDFAQFENSFLDTKRYNDIDLFRAVESAIRFPNTYKARLSSVIREAMILLDESDTDSEYMDRYYIELCSRYIPLEEDEYSYAEKSEWDGFFRMNANTVLLTVCVIFMSCGSFTNERKTGMYGIIHTAKNGEAPTRIVKLTYTALSSTVITFLFTVIPLIIYAVSCGLEGISLPIQSFNEFVLCPYSITAGEYIILFTLVRILIFTTIGLVSAVLNQITENEKTSLVLSPIVIVVGIAAAKLPLYSQLGFLAKYNITKLASVNVLFTRYQGVNLLGFCADYAIVVPILFMLLICITCTVSLLYRPRIIHEIKHSSVRLTDTSYTLSLIKSELFKQLISEYGIYIIITSVIIKCVVSFVYYRPPQTDTERLYRDYITEYSGVYTEEKAADIAKEYNYIMSSLSIYENAKNDYRDGRLSEEDYSEYERKYNYANHRLDACKRIYEKSAVLAEISAVHPEASFIYDEGFERFFSSPADIVMLTAMLLLGSGAFGTEYESGFCHIIRTSKKGREYLFHAKISCSVIIPVILFIISTLTELSALYMYYGTRGLNVAVQSIGNLSAIKTDISVIGYLLINRAVSLAGFISGYQLIGSLSAVFEGRLKSIAASVCLFVFPFLAYRLGYIGMITPGMIKLMDIFSYIVCLVISIVFMRITESKWIKNS